jgi:two-component system, OmpR family, phosphate regulon sensor histidine kinase PhoR
MRTRVFGRIFIGYLLVILMLAGASIIAFGDAFRTLYEQTLADNLKSLILALRPEASEFVGRGETRQLKEFVRKTGSELNTRITVIDAAGRVLADSHENPGAMENHRSRPEVAEALSGSVGRSTRFSSTTSRDAVYVAVPLLDNGHIVGALRANLFLKDIRFPPGFIARMIAIGIVLSFLALAAAFLIARSVSRPIKELTAASRKLAEGDFNTRVFLKRNDEFKQLAETFNGMSREISGAFDELSRQKSELKNIIDSLEEGLLVVDEKGVVVYSNRSLRTLLGHPAALEGGSYWEDIFEPALVELIEKARKGEAEPREEIEIRGRSFLWSSAHLEKEGETVLVLHDITSRRELDTVKRDLVSSVSHELRTPLTSIKGFAETLEEDLTGENRRYAEIIKRNSDRLINMVRDLLVLSELEERPADLQREETDVRQLAENMIRIFDSQANQKGISIALQSQDDLPTINCDSFKLEQVFINLLDNAVKYTDEGRITVSLTHDERTFSVEIEDTGIGIPRDRLPRIFERFYVVDKSRSRKTGGTGLGLSIVKHIVLLHGGDVSVESTEGTGTRFVVTLPFCR